MREEVTVLESGLRGSSMDRNLISELDVEAAWSEEIQRRLAEIDAGTVELVPWEEVRAELFGQPK